MAQKQKKPTVKKPSKAKKTTEATNDKPEKGCVCRINR